MKVSVIDDESCVTRHSTTDEPVEEVINTDKIVRFCTWTIKGVQGTYIKFVDGTTIHVLDPMQEIIDVVLQADAKKAK